MDAGPNIPDFRKMLEGISFTISVATAIYIQEGINQFRKFKAFYNYGQGMYQAEHLIDVLHKPSGGQDGHVINARSQ